jgi:hypothetical protein
MARANYQQRQECAPPKIQRHGKQLPGILIVIVAMIGSRSVQKNLRGFDAELREPYFI